MTCNDTFRRLPSISVAFRPQTASRRPGGHHPRPAPQPHVPRRTGRRCDVRPRTPRRHHATPRSGRTLDHDLLGRLHGVHPGVGRRFSSANRTAGGPQPRDAARETESCRAVLMTATGSVEAVSGQFLVSAVTRLNRRFHYCVPPMCHQTFGAGRPVEPDASPGARPGTGRRSSWRSALTPAAVAQGALPACSQHTSPS